MRNGSKFEKLIWDKGLTLNMVAEGTGVSYPTLVDINKGRIKKYHKRTLRDVCDYLTNDEKIITTEDILGLIEEAKQDKDINQEQQNTQPDGKA